MRFAGGGLSDMLSLLACCTLVWCRAILAMCQCVNAPVWDRNWEVVTLVLVVANKLVCAQIK
jgi:hypothetical protein